MTLALAVSLIAAFIGLGFALDITGDALNLTGVALAITAAVLNTALILLNRRLVGEADSRPVSFYMLASAAIAVVIASLISGTYPVPETVVGITAFLGVGVFYAFSIISFFAALSMIGPIRNGLFMNFEPVTSVFLGFVLLGQVLAPLQLLGAAIVVCAIVFVALNNTKPHND